MPANIKDIAWLAGLLEGEASFRVNEDGTTPEIKLSMTDFDVVKRAYDITGHQGPLRTIPHDNKKDEYVFILSNPLSIQWMMTIYTLMGIRRKAKIYEIISLWKKYERRYKEICINGHDLTDENNISVQTHSDGHKYRVCKQCRVDNAQKSDVKRLIMRRLLKQGLSKEEIESKISSMFEELKNEPGTIQ